jgi:hypothetical protein
MILHNTREHEERHGVDHARYRADLGRDETHECPAGSMVQSHALYRAELGRGNPVSANLRKEQHNGLDSGPRVPV